MAHITTVGPQCCLTTAHVKVREELAEETGFELLRLVMYVMLWYASISATSEKLMLLWLIKRGVYKDLT